MFTAPRCFNSAASVDGRNPSMAANVHPAKEDDQRHLEISWQIGYRAFRGWTDRVNLRCTIATADQKPIARETLANSVAARAELEIRRMPNTSPPVAPSTRSKVSVHVDQPRPRGPRARGYARASLRSRLAYSWAHGLDPGPRSGEEIEPHPVRALAAGTATPHIAWM
jgi:hypothetical protein